MLNVNFKNLGSLNKADMNINKLTVLCGENNTGKTYVNYALYGLIYNLISNIMRLSNKKYFAYGTGVLTFSLEEIIDKELDQAMNDISVNYSKNLYTVFNTSRDMFKNTSFNFRLDKENLKKLVLDSYYDKTNIIGEKDVLIKIQKEINSYDMKISYFNIEENENDKYIDVVDFVISREISEIIFNSFSKNAFLLPAERTGLNLFFKELNVNRNRMFQELALLNTEKRKSAEMMEYILRERVTAYPKPIADYIEFLNKLDILSKQDSEYKDIALEIQEKVIQGTYQIEDKDIYFIPMKNSKKLDKKINLHVSSSTVKTFFGLVFYLNHIAQKGDYLIIDEPEQNLHPDNQRKIARIIAKIVNRGINVIISTHSDYIIKEFNNLIMLKNQFSSRDELLHRYHYEESELLNIDEISPYIFVDNTMRQMEINRQEGIIASTFDDVINAYNVASDEIYYAIQEEE